MAKGKSGGGSSSNSTEQKESFWAWTNNATVGSFLGGLASGLCLLVIGLGITAVRIIDSHLSSIDVEIGKIKQSIADGGGHQIVSQLKGANTPAQIAAQMTVIKGQIQLAYAEGKKPNPEKIATLAPAMAEAAKRYPNVSESWSAVSTLATYRTSSIEFPQHVPPNQLPNCDIESAKPGGFYPESLGFPPSPIGMEVGYVFKDCRLYLDHLPGHMLQGKIKDATGEMADAMRGRTVRIGVSAYAVNVVLIWHGEVSDTDILAIHTLNCRFEFSTDHTPTPKGQELLLAALESPTAGSSLLKVD